jgi:hypothetical protein
MIDKFGDSLDAFAATFQLVASIETAVSGMIDAVPVVGAFIDAAMDFGREIVEYDINNLRACVTEEFEDAVFCALYCELGNDGVITDEIYQAWVSGVASQPLCTIGLTLVGQVMALMMLAVGAQNARNRAFIFATSGQCRTVCDDCPEEWVVHLLGGFDHAEFFTNESGREGHNYAFTYNPTTDHLEAGLAENGAYYLGWSLDASAAETITFIRIGMNAPGGTGGGLLLDKPISSNDFDTGFSFDMQYSTAGHVDKILLIVGSVNPGIETLSVEIRGTGTNPFV